MGGAASRGLIELVLVAALVAALVVAVAAKTQGDGLVPVPALDYVNDYPAEGFRIVCSHRGSRADFAADGSDIAVGDRVVRDCKVVAR